MPTLSKPVAVVTGVTRGLGAALASALLRRGYSVAGCSTTEAGVLGVAVRQVDVCDATALDRFAQEITTRFGTIDVWVNNAGVLGPVGPLRDANHVEWERAVAVNLEGVVEGTHAFLSRRSDSAVLVNIASRAGVRPSPGISVYAATKAAVISLTQSVAEEERAGGLRTYAVLPPSMDTDMQDVLLRQDPRVFPGVAESRRRRDEGRIASADAVAERVLSMVLDRANDDVVIDLTGD